MNIFWNRANCVIAHVLKCNCKFTLIFSTLWFCLFKNEISIAPGLGSIRCNRIKWIKRESKCGRRIKLSSRSPFTHLLTFSTSVPREDAPANGRNVEGRLNCSPIHLSPFCHLLYLVNMQGHWLWCGWAMSWVGYWQSSYIGLAQAHCGLWYGAGAVLPTQGTQQCERVHTANTEC